jgi:hypothetical protein
MVRLDRVANEIGLMLWGHFWQCPQHMELMVGETVDQERYRPSMTEHHTDSRTKITATDARAAVTGHNVRFVLAASLMGVVIIFAGLLFFWSA